MTRRATPDAGAILDALDDGVILTDADGTVTWATAAAERHFGTDPGALVGRRFDCLVPGDAAASADALRRVQDVEVGRCVVQLRPGADGSGLRVLDVRGVNQLQGPELAIVFVSRDISEQAAIERGLRDSERRYRRLVENAGDIIFQCDIEGYFTFVNRTASAVMGYSPEELIGRHFTDLVRPDHRERLVELYVAQRDERRSETYFEFPALTRAGKEVWIGQQVQVVIEGGEVVGVQAVARDMTERRQFEAQLQEARRLEAIGTLAGGVAHDFNNLLQTIRGNAELTVIRLGADIAGTDVQTILDASDRASALVRQLLAFGQRQPLRPVALHVGDAIGAVCRDWVSIFRRSIDLELHCDPSAPPIRFDPVQFEQVLVNLLLNARDAMPRGGRIVIGAEAVQMTTALREQLRASLGDGQFVCITVLDTGEGMSEETLGHIFEPFFTTKEQGKGTGLGLSSAYGIVTQGGGHIAVRSRLGEGTVFSVYLPANEAGSADAADPPGAVTPQA